MGRDYAARNRKPPPPARFPAWVWMVAGLSLGLAVAVLVYIGRPAESMPMVQTPQRVAGAQIQQKIEIEPVGESEFDFYKLLRQQEVDVPPGDDLPKSGSAARPQPSNPAPKPLPANPVATPATKPPAAAPVPAPRAFAIALGSFSTQSNADALRAQLQLNGVESRIHTIKDAQGKTLFQVRTRTDASEAAARTRLAQLKGNGFEGRLVPLN